MLYNANRNNGIKNCPNETLYRGVLRKSEFDRLNYDFKKTQNEENNRRNEIILKSYFTKSFLSFNKDEDQAKNFYI